MLVTCRKIFQYPVDQQMISAIISSWQWRHNGCDGVSNHQPHHCVLNRVFWRRSKKTSKLRVTGLKWNLPVTGEFPAPQMASKEWNISISWRNHDAFRGILGFYMRKTCVPRIIPSGVGVEVLEANQVRTLTLDALAPCIVGSSSFHHDADCVRKTAVPRKGFQRPVPVRLWVMIKWEVCFVMFSPKKYIFIEWNWVWKRGLRLNNGGNRIQMGNGWCKKITIQLLLIYLSNKLKYT